MITTKADLDRCAKRQHVYRNSKLEGYQVCEHCRQVDPIPDCMFYISPEQPECGQPGRAVVIVRNRAVKATVYLCEMHKAVHDEGFARARTRKSA